MSRINFDIIKQASKAGELSDQMVYMLLGQKPDYDEQYVNELQNKVPQELLNYRFLMHPIRLMIVKLLHSEGKLTSTEIKRALGISWGEYSTHIRALEKKGYISTSEEFKTTGSIAHTITLLEHARTDYLQLIQILSELIDPLSPFDFMMNADYRFSRDGTQYPLG